MFWYGDLLLRFQVRCWQSTTTIESTLFHCQTPKKRTQFSLTTIRIYAEVTRWISRWSSWINYKFFQTFIDSGWKRIFFRNNFHIYICTSFNHLHLAELGSSKGSMETSCWRVNFSFGNRKHFDCFDRQHNLYHTGNYGKKTWKEAATNQNVQSYSCFDGSFLHLSTSKLGLRSVQAEQQFARKHSLGDKLCTRLDGHGQLHVQSIPLHVPLGDDSSHNIPCWHFLWHLHSLF